MPDIQSLFTTFIPNIWAVITARIYLRHAQLSGKRIRIWGRPAITIKGTAIIQDRVRMVSQITPIEIAVDKNAILEIGESAFINYGTSIAAMKHVKIGKNVLIGTYVNITDNNFHRVEPERRKELPESFPVCISDNVWLGTRVIVLPGVTIGEGSVIGAGSVVTHDIPPRVIAAGTPAKVIRPL